MDDRVEPVHVLRGDIPQVHPKGRNLQRFRAKGAVLEQPAIQTRHLMPGLLKEADQDRTDVPLMTRYQYLHKQTSINHTPERSLPRKGLANPSPC